jgi:hypothetical protein
MNDAEDLEVRWQAANAGLADLTAAGVPDDDPRVRDLLGELDRIEYEVGVLQGGRVKRAPQEKS